MCAAERQIYVDRFVSSLGHCVHCADCEQLLFVIVFLLSLRMCVTNNVAFLIIVLSLHQQKTQNKATKCHIFVDSITRFSKNICWMEMCSNTITSVKHTFNLISTVPRTDPEN